MSEKSSDGGLHIDSDWKTEAAREKERLARQEEQEQAKPASAAESATFAELVNLIALQAGVALGGYQGPEGEKIPPNPHAAKYYVDLLEVLQAKTEGNLQEEEKRMLNAVSHELRMLYVQAVTGPLPATEPKTNA